MEYIGNILYDEKLLRKDSRLIIFGSGVYGKRVLEYLDLNDAKDNIICFCDSNGNLEGRNIAGIPIYQTKDVFIKYPNADYLISGKYLKEMYQILRKAGLYRIHILIS